MQPLNAKMLIAPWRHVPVAAALAHQPDCHAQGVGMIMRAYSIPASFVVVDADGIIRYKIAGQVHYPRLGKLVVPLRSQAKQS